MAVFNNSPRDDWETAFEQGAGQVKKTVKQAAATVAADIKEQVTGSGGNQAKPEAGTAGGAVAEEKPEEERKKLLEQTRINLAELEKRIKEVREKRLQKEKQLAEAAIQKSEQKKAVEEKKQRESIEMANIKKKGATEILKGVSG